MSFSEQVPEVGDCYSRTVKCQAAVCILLLVVAPVGALLPGNRAPDSLQARVAAADWLQDVDSWQTVVVLLEPAVTGTNSCTYL